MKKKIRIGILMLFILPGIAKAQYPALPKTAIEMNNYLASYTDSLYKKGTDWGNIFVACKESKDFSALVKPRKDFDIYIKNSIAEIKSLKDVGGSEDLRKAFISFLNYEKTALAHFIPFEKLNSNTTEDEIDKLLKDLDDFSKNEAIELEKLKTAQEAYATKNNFTIDSGK